MGQFDLNLSTRPFRSYRVQTFLLTLALIGLIAASVWQFLGFKKYSSLEAQIRREAQNAQIEADVLGRQLAELDSKLNRPEAVGKISEILGKRSATITGEATVEVQTTNQQLHTPYAQKGTQHTQSGAEINRDEVPVALQPYVQQYFEQVRKQAAPATPAAVKK